MSKHWRNHVEGPRLDIAGQPDLYPPIQTHEDFKTKLDDEEAMLRRIDKRALELASEAITQTDPAELQPRERLQVARLAHEVPKAADLPDIEGGLPKVVISTMPDKLDGAPTHRKYFAPEAIPTKFGDQTRQGIDSGLGWILGKNKNRR